MSLEPRPEIKKLKTGYHGGPDYAELAALGFAPDAVLDFSVSTNPYMPPPGITDRLCEIPLDKYPDSATTELRQRFAATLGISADNIIAGNGITELIRLIALAYFRRGDSALVVEPTYGDYEIACRIMGTKVVRFTTQVENSFTFDRNRAGALLRKHRPRAVFLGNPNNPTGQYLAREDIEALLTGLEDGLLVLDEAYLAFVARPWNSVDLISRGNVLLLRSMTKEFGLTGLRLGFALASPEIIGHLRRVCPPWNVNIVAQKMGAAALEHLKYLTQTKSKIREARQYLVREITRLGYPVLPSAANFFLVKVGRAAAFRAALLRHGILVRDCTSFGLPEYVRIAPRTLPECRKLIDAIEDEKAISTKTAK